jgi:hypothetical protein
VEVYAFLVGATVFKTGETEVLGLAGSIPVHLRHRPGPLGHPDRASFHTHGTRPVAGAP